MTTKVLKNAPAEAAALLRAGELVAVPTETVYGLAANGLDAAAVERIYAVKGRPEGKALSLLVSGSEALSRYGRGSPAGAAALAERFWPGPLTIVVKAAEGLPPNLLAGGDTVALRCPAEPQTLALLRELEIPLAAPSANPSGAPSAKTAAEVLDYFDGRIAAVIDGGAAALGRESTILDLSAAPYRVLRAGALAEADIQQALLDELQIVGVTGGSGCGKTTALQALEELGALVIDADAEYHKLCAENMDMLAEINARFPDVVQEGVLQRKKLGAIVFSDPAALAALQEITDRYVSARLNELMAQHAAFGGKIAAVDAIDIIGTPLEKILTATVGITAPVELRVQRLMARESIGRDYALLRIGAQKPDSFFRAHCTATVENNGTKEEFREKCLKTFRELLEV